MNPSSVATLLKGLSIATEKDWRRGIHQRIGGCGLYRNSSRTDIQRAREKQFAAAAGGGL
jgi:hypothetical protein